MSLLHQRSLILVKVESTKGTDAAPTGADAIEVAALSPNVIMAEQVERTLLGGSVFLNPHKLLTAKFAKCGGTVELAGSGAAGTATKWGRILRAGGYLETVNSNSVVYTPRSSGFEGASFRQYLDGVEVRGRGGVATGKMVFAAGAVPGLEFELTGNYNRPTDVATPAATLMAANVMAVDDGNSSITLHSQSVAAESIEFELGGVLQTTDNINNSGAFLSALHPIGNITFRYDKISVKDWMQAVEEVTEAALVFIHGVGAGNIVEVRADKCSLGPPTMSEVRGEWYLSCPLMFGNNSAGVPLTITTK